MGLLKKLTKPLSKVLDKIVPNEIKPALPYLAAFAPFYMPPGMQFAQSGIFSNPMFTRALMSGAANLGSQLSQEGSEGDFNPFSVAMASGVGALGAQNAPEFFQGMQRGPTGVDKFGPIEVPYSDTGIMASVSDAIGKGGASAAKFIGEAGKVLRPGGKEVGLNLPTLEAASIPISQGTGDLALADAQLALRDYENEMANQDQLSLIDDDGRRRAIRAAMEAAGHLEEIIVDTLAELGLKDGGRVGLKHGGQLVKRGPGRPGYGGPHETEAAGRSYAAATSPGGGGGDAWQRQALKDFAKLSSTTTGGTRGTIDQNQLRKNIDLKGIWEAVPKIDPKWLTKAGKYLSYLNPIGSASAEEIDFSKLPGATETFTPSWPMGSSMNFGVNEWVGNNPNPTKGAFVDALQSGQFGGATTGAFGKNVNELFGGVDLDAKTFSTAVGDVDPTFIGTGDGFGGYIDVNKSQLNPDALEKLPEGFFKAKGGLASVLPKGREADYRGGGVIPVGSRERADDVPARLSKNEFVMTADAVRAAGGGSINKGAKRMYNLMHNLEARV